MSGLGRASDALLALTSAVGLALAILAYTNPDSGVSGSAGALLVCGASAALLIAAAIFLLRPAMPMPLWRTLEVLAVLGALCSVFAGYMLMQAWFTVAMLLVLLATVGHFGRDRRLA